MRALLLSDPLPYGGLTLSTARMMPSLHEMPQLRRIPLPRTPVNKGIRKGRGLWALALRIDPVGVALVVGRVEDHCKPLAILIDHAQLVRLKSGRVERRCLDQREHDLVAVR